MSPDPPAIHLIHGAPAQALSDVLAALAELARGLSWTANTDLPPKPFVIARLMRDTATALRDAAHLLDDAAHRTQINDGISDRSSWPC